MTWLPPFFMCGECGGEIGRWPAARPTATQRAVMADLDRDVVYDWRHRTVPNGVGPHHPILGTKAGDARLHVQTEELPAPREALPLPEVPARPALHGELPTTAERLDRKAEANGWLVEAWFMRGPHLDQYWRVNRTTSSVVLRLVRAGHRLVACWETDVQDRWKFEFAYSLGRYVEPIGSPELNRIVEEPLMTCDSCGEIPALHVSTGGGLVCNDEYQAAMADLLTEEVPICASS